MTDKSKFTRFFIVHHHYSKKIVKTIELKVSAKDVTKGEIYVTDLQLQEGEQPTAITPNTMDFLKKLHFTIDEAHNEVDGLDNIYQGDKPIVFKDMEDRFYNIVGRGFETITLPNVFHEDFSVPVLTTGLDLTLYAKDDYDFLRVATFYGSEIEEDQDRVYKTEELAENPLNTRYTKEFCFNGGKAGDKIEILASKQMAKVNDKVVPVGVQRFDVGEEMEFDEITSVTYENRQRFMALPVGATRLSVQFMGIVRENSSDFMGDTGIGFHGLAKFNQWTWGVSDI